MVDRCLVRIGCCLESGVPRRGRGGIEEAGRSGPKAVGDPRFIPGRGHPGIWVSGHEAAAEGTVSDGTGGSPGEVRGIRRPDVAELICRPGCFIDPTEKRNCHRAEVRPVAKSGWDPPRLAGAAVLVKRNPIAFLPPPTSYRASTEGSRRDPPRRSGSPAVLRATVPLHGLWYHATDSLAWSVSCGHKHPRHHCGHRTRAPNRRY